MTPETGSWIPGLPGGKSILAATVNKALRNLRLLPGDFVEGERS